MNRNTSLRAARMLALAVLLMLVPAVSACTGGGAMPALPGRVIMKPKPCTKDGSLIGFHERHPDKQLYSWRDLAQDTLDPATCLHEAGDVNLFAVYVYETDEWVSFAVDFDNGHLYNKIDVVVFRSDPFYGPDVVLSAEALAELREAIDRYQVLDWPFRDPGEITYVGEYVNPNKFELAVVFSDDTGSFADQQTASDPDMVGFLKFAQTFLAEHVE